MVEYSMKLCADISQFYTIKTAFEQVFGNKAWLDLKECTSLAIWKKYVTKLLRAVRLAIEETTQVRDDDWFAQVCECIEHGLQITTKAKTIEELLSGLSATLISVVFLQIGMFPDRRGLSDVTLARDNWRLDNFRTVQYVQSNKQLEALFWSTQQRALGVEKQMNLWGKYRASKSKVPYSKWCQSAEISSRT
jgi:hypothetical protein